MADQRSMALRCLQLARTKLVQRAPFLTQALYAMPLVEVEENLPLQTDGRCLYYNVARLWQDARANPRELVCQLFHAVAHCLLGHPAQCRTASDRALADLMADVCVENLLQQMGIYRGDMDRYQIQTRYRPLSATLRRFGNMTRHQRQELLDTSALYYGDDHSRWYQDAPLTGSAAPVDGVDWQKMADQLRTLGGRDAGTFCDAVDSELTMEQVSAISYRDLLAEYLGQPRERMTCDPDTIDARWYHLGMELYGDTPLVEPLEETEMPQPGDTVVALDTSGSCDGEICRRFLRETAALLRDLEGGTTLLLQCDEVIRQELLIRDEATMEQALREFRPRGFGGTDFCPVFRRVEQLRREGTLQNIRCLIYLTDGEGRFPDAPPDYPVLFLIPEEGRRLCNLPRWVRPVTLHTDSFALEE